MAKHEKVGVLGKDKKKCSETRKKDKPKTRMKEAPPEQYKKRHNIGKRLSACRMGTYKEADMAFISSFANRQWQIDCPPVKNVGKEKKEMQAANKGKTDIVVPSNGKLKDGSLCKSKLVHSGKSSVSLKQKAVTKTTDSKKKMKSSRTSSKSVSDSVSKMKTKAKKVKVTSMTCSSSGKYTKMYKNWFPREPHIKREASLNAAAKTNIMLDEPLSNKSQINAPNKVVKSGVNRSNVSKHNKVDAKETNHSKGVLVPDCKKSNKSGENEKGKSSSDGNKKVNKKKCSVHLKDSNIQRTKSASLYKSKISSKYTSKKGKLKKKKTCAKSTEKNSKKGSDTGDKKAKKRKCEVLALDLSIFAPTPKRKASLNAQAIINASEEPARRRNTDKEATKECARTRTELWKSYKAALIPKDKHFWVEGLGENYLNCNCNLLRNKAEPVTQKRTESPGACISPENIRVDDIPSSRHKFLSDPDVSSHVSIVSGKCGLIESLNHTSPLQQSCSFPYTHSNRIVPSSNFQSFSLGSVGSITNYNMMTYHRPYRSAFSVPNCSYGPPDPIRYGYYQLTGPVVHTDHRPCVITHPHPVQVSQPAVHVLINNIDTPKREPGDEIVEMHQEKIIISDDETEKVIKSCSTTCEKPQKKKASGKNTENSKQVKRKSSSSSSDVPEKRGANVVKKSAEKQSGWHWEGQSEMKSVLTMNPDDPPEQKLCYPAIRHDDGDVIKVRDCVLVRSGPRKKDIPFVAKVYAFWEQPNSGEMMMSLFWYYRPEQTESDKLPRHISSEIFASKHRDETSIACIEEKCYVLTLGEYCRYYATLKKKEEGLSIQQVVPPPEEATNTHRIPPLDADPELIFLCRRVYDYKLKRVLKNPM